MTLAADITDGCGLGDEARCELLPIKRRNAVFVVHYMVKGVYPAV